jgi:hypothetical protein
MIRSRKCHLEGVRFTDGYRNKQTVANFEHLIFFGTRKGIIPGKKVMKLVIYYEPTIN